MMSEVQTTHPWLTFTLDVSRVPTRTWVVLGEAAAILGFIRTVPLLPEESRSLHEIFLAKGALATTAIEGNTLTEEQARLQIEGQLNLPPSKRYLGTEIDNVVGAWNEMASQVFGGGHRELSPQWICDLNRKILTDVPLPEEAIPGQFRLHNVTVGRYRGAEARFVEPLMDRYCSWLSDAHVWKVDDDAMGLPVAIIKAIVAHVYFAWIHPFGDGNGRTARLIEAYLLMRAGAPSIAVHLLSNFYNATRSEYYRQLDAASRSGGDLVPFITYAVQGFVDELKQQIEIIRGQQMRVTWEKVVRDGLKSESRSVADRREALLLALFKHYVTVGDLFVTRAGLVKLDPEVALAYAKPTEKTLTRDLNALTSKGFIVREPGKGVKAAVNLVLGLLPSTVDQ